MNSPATRRRLAEEGGFTIVEVLVAALNTFRSEQDQVVVNRLQDEMERIRQLPFNQVALTAKPTSSGQTSDPGVRVSADGTHFDLNRNGTNTKLLAYAGGLTPDGTPMANSMLSMLHMLGRDDVKQFGDSTGELDLNNASEPAKTTDKA